MKKMNKKGFTIVELVIVIAVIAILAAVMIPTFSGIIEKANKSAVQQKATALYKEALALDLADGVQNGKEGTADITTVSGCTVTYDGTDFSYTDANGNVAVFDGSAWTITLN